MNAFEVSRSTLFEWKRRLRDGDGKLCSLEKHSRRPRQFRVMTTSSHTVQAVCDLRTSFPYLGPKKLAKILKRDHGISVGHATVWKIIVRCNLPSAPRQYVARRKRRKQKTRLPKEFVAKNPGDLVSMDTVVLQEHGKKKYIITALDHATRIAVAWAYERQTSKQARDLLLRMHLLLGCPIENILTDNGSEFEAQYDQVCTDMNIKHCWTYPKSPEMNAHTERFNRTIQEEAQFPVFSAPTEEWNAWISHYIQQYNCYRPHVSLDYECPLDKYVELVSKTPLESRMYRGHTFPLPLIYVIL